MIYLASLQATATDRLSGYTLIKTREELDRVIANNTQSNRVIIRGDFSAEYFTPSGLGIFIENVRTINRNVIIELDEGSDVQTIETFARKLQKVSSVDDLLFYLTHYPNEFYDTVMTLTTKENRRQSELLQASNNMSKMQTVIDQMKEQIGELKYSLQIEQANKYEAQSKLNALVKRVNHQYGAYVDTEHMFRIDENHYDKILYIKEITRVQYVDSLVYYLKEIFKVLYSMPTRACVIESYYSEGKKDLYPGYVPHYELTERDVISSDILMLGMQPSLMRDILRNTAGISLLVVLDRSGYATPCIKGSNVEYIYTASDINDIPEDIPNNRVISYTQDTLFIPYVKGFMKADRSDRMKKYSSMDIVKSLVRLVEGR